MIKYIFLFSLLFFNTPGVAQDIQPLVVRYPASDTNPHYYKRVKYYVEILDLALKKSGVNYRLEKISLPFMNESRSKHNLTHKIYDVHWMNAQAFLEPDLIPVRIPLCKGLTGWRIFFIRPENQKLFSGVTNLNDLRKLTVGNGHDWPEVVLYKHNNLRQRLSPSWKSLFRMLDKKRVDYISRSALEIFDEEDAFPDLNLSIETQLTIHYPAAYYFYVDKYNPELANIIESGLKTAIVDGSFDQVFNRYFSEKIKKANLSKRHVIEIPFIASDKFIDTSIPAYWYKPLK